MKFSSEGHLKIIHFFPCVSSMGAATNNLQHADKSHDRLNHINVVPHVRFSLNKASVRRHSDG